MTTCGRCTRIRQKAAQVANPDLSIRDRAANFVSAGLDFVLGREAKPVAPARTRWMREQGLIWRWLPHGWGTICKGCDVCCQGCSACNLSIEEVNQHG